MDNTDRRLDVDDDEVTIGRKLLPLRATANTPSTAHNVRLKDIYELFLDTGLGRGRLFRYRAGPHRRDRGREIKRAAGNF